jgi:predicted O-linked N-acetylglucosamine transferase (SPINDLY family)
VEASPGVALDYFERSLIAEFDSGRARRIGEIHGQWAAPRSPVPVRAGSGLKVAHIVSGLFAAQEPTRHLQMLCDGLRTWSADSAVFSTEWAASWFFNSPGAGHSEKVSIRGAASTWQPALESDFLDRARAVSDAVRAYDPDVAVYHASFFEQIASRVAAFRPAPLQVHINYGREMDVGVFDARIHCSRQALTDTRYPASVQWIPCASDVLERMAAEEPISRRSIGMDSAASVSATFGDLDRICSPAYVATLTEILIRFPNHYHLFAGQGNVRSMRQTLHAEGVLPRVRFLGPMGNVTPLLSALDFYLAPFPNMDREFVLEAMGAGKPVVIQRKATDPRNGFGSELVNHEDLVVDNQGGYVEAVSRMIRHSALRAKLSEFVRERFNAEFTPKAMAKLYVDLFETLLAAS